jgi:hypothetical protein
MEDKVREALVITQEESAEVIQEVSKIFRFGIDEPHKSGATHRAMLEAEVGDLLAMVDILVDLKVIDPANLATAKAAKIAKLHKWSNIFS